MLAHYSDNTVRDITSLAVFTSSDNDVASVTVNASVVRGESHPLIQNKEKQAAA